MLLLISGIIASDIASDIRPQLSLCQNSFPSLKMLFSILLLVASVSSYVVVPSVPSSGQFSKVHRVVGSNLGRGYVRGYVGQPFTPFTSLYSTEGGDGVDSSGEMGVSGDKSALEGGSDEGEAEYISFSDANAAIQAEEEEARMKERGKGHKGWKSRE